MLNPNGGLDSVVRKGRINEKNFIFYRYYGVVYM